MAKLSDTALVLLNKAAARDDRLAEPLNHLPAAARNAVVRSLIKQGLLIEDAVELNHPLAWRTDESDADPRCSIALRITDDGFRSLNIDPPGEVAETATEAPAGPDTAPTQREAVVDVKAPEAGHSAPVPATRASLRHVAAAVLMAWDSRDTQQHVLDEAIERLRTALTTKTGRPVRTPGAPRIQVDVLVIPDNQLAEICCLLGNGSCKCIGCFGTLGPLKLKRGSCHASCSQSCGSFAPRHQKHHY